MPQLGKDFERRGPIQTFSAAPPLFAPIPSIGLNRFPIMLFPFLCPKLLQFLVKAVRHFSAQGFVNVSRLWQTGRHENSQAQLPISPCSL